jgi:primosomal protein N' (replication factor Y)
VAASRHDFPAFAERESELRRSPAYAPHVALANVIVSGEQQEDVATTAAGTARWLRGLISARALEGLEVVGPAPAPLQRIKGRWRWHLLLRSSDPSLLGRVLRYISARNPVARANQRVRIVIDRDPVSLL